MQGKRYHSNATWNICGLLCERAKMKADVGIIILSNPLSKTAAQFISTAFIIQ